MAAGDILHHKVTALADNPPVDGVGSLAWDALHDIAGTAGQIPFWSSATRFTGSTKLAWDDTNGILSIPAGFPAGLDFGASNLRIYSGGSHDVKVYDFTNNILQLDNTRLNVGRDTPVGWTAGLDATQTADTTIWRDAAGVLALKNGTNPNEFRAYGTVTGPKAISLKHDGSDGTLDVLASSGKLILGGNASDLQWGKALVALGGGAAATLGTIGGSGPATAAQNSWVQMRDSTGALVWIPAFK